MPTIQEQFTYEEISNHFEKDTHIGVQGLEIEKIHVLYGETSPEDILSTIIYLMIIKSKIWKVRLR